MTPAQSNPPHILHGALLEDRITIVVAGAGGNGGQMLGLLARLHFALKALGHPHGLHVRAFDPNPVREANIGRQLWSPADIGYNKAIVAVQRINLFYGFDWTARPVRYDPMRDSDATDCDILVSCVDNRRARAAFHEAIVHRRGPQHYYLDLGNEEAIGQVVLGEATVGAVGDFAADRLPLPTELFPDLRNTNQPEVDANSCSLRISLQSQGLFINDFMARVAAQLLYRLLSRGRLTTHGALVNLDSMRMNPIAVDRGVWVRLGCIRDPRLMRGDKRRRAA